MSLSGWPLKCMLAFSAARRHGTRRPRGAGGDACGYRGSACGRRRGRNSARITPIAGAPAPLDCTRILSVGDIKKIRTNSLYVSPDCTWSLFVCPRVIITPVLEAPVPSTVPGSDGPPRRPARQRGKIYFGSVHCLSPATCAAKRVRLGQTERQRLKRHLFNCDKLIVKQ